MEGPTTPTDPPSDFVTFGHYRVARRADGGLDELGKGAMGVTYRAMDTELRIPVALKVIGMGLVDDETARRRFQREARAAAQLRHPNVASVLHLGREGGDFFYAMEFVEGRLLASLLKEAGPLAPPVALALAAQVAAALVAAHKRGLVHRDLKPANLMLLEGDAVEHEDERTAAAGGRQVKVIDFGMVRTFGARREADSFASRSDLFPGLNGTPAYASPEQCTGIADLDGRSDLYSLGIILWQCLVGRVPFTGSPAQVIGMHQFQPPPMAHLEGQPTDVVELLVGLLEKDPDQRRPPTASELRDRLDALRHASLFSAHPAAPVVVPATSSPVTAALPFVTPAPAGEDTAATQTSLGTAATMHDSRTANLSPQSRGSAPKRSRWLTWSGTAVGVLLVPFVLLPMLRNTSSAPMAGSDATSRKLATPSLLPTTRLQPTQQSAPSLGSVAAEAAKRNFAAALSQATTIADANRKSGALVKIAIAQVRTGDVIGAKATAETAGDAYRKSNALGGVAEAQAKVGDVVGAKATTETISDIPCKAIALGGIAEVQARAGDAVGAKVSFDQAKATAATVLDGNRKAIVLREIAAAQAKAGDVAEAKMTAAMITDAGWKTGALLKIATAQAKAGDVAGAKTTVAAILDASRKGDAIGEIAEAQAKAGDVAGAKAMAETNSDASRKGGALRGIAEAQAKAGDIAGAKATAETIADAYSKASALGGITVAQAKAGDIAGAQATAETIADAFRKASALGVIAEAQAKVGDVAGAKATVARIADSSDKTRTLREIGAAQSWREGISPAEEWAKSLTDPLERCYALLGVAEAAGAMAQGRTKPDAEDEE